MQFLIQHGADLVAVVTSVLYIASEMIPVLTKGDIGGVIHLLGVVVGAIKKDQEVKSVDPKP